jgi:hypothetical protein
MNAEEAKKLVDQISEIMDKQSELMNQILRASQEMMWNTQTVAALGRQQPYKIIGEAKAAAEKSACECYNCELLKEKWGVKA